MSDFASADAAMRHSIEQLRFTRYNVSADQFESKMEYTNDGGKTWLPGNQQVFDRRGTSKHQNRDY